MFKTLFIEPTNNYESLMEKQRKIMVKIMQVLNVMPVTSIETSIDIYSILSNFANPQYNGYLFGIDLNVNTELEKNKIVFRNDNFKNFEDFMLGDYVLEIQGDLGF